MKFALSILMLLLAAGCGGSPKITVTAKTQRNLLSKDEVLLINTSGFDLQNPEVHLTARYGTGEQKLYGSWSAWGAGETKSIALPANLNGLQEFSVSGKYVYATQAGEIKDRYGSFRGSWNMQ